MTNEHHKATVRCNWCEAYFDEDETGDIFECPNCNTDEYLVDLREADTRKSPTNT